MYDREVEVTGGEGRSRGHGKWESGRSREQLRKRGSSGSWGREGKRGIERGIER